MYVESPKNYFGGVREVQRGWSTVMTSQMTQRTFSVEVWGTYSDDLVHESPKNPYLNPLVKVDVFISFLTVSR